MIAFLKLFEPVVACADRSADWSELRVAWRARRLFSGELRPRLRWATVKQVLPPIPLRMQAEEFLGVEWGAVGAAEDPPHRHLFGRCGRRYLPVDRAGRV